MSAIRKVAWGVGVLVLAVAAVYLFRYLYRWEWHRAMFTALLIVTTEVALATALVLRAVRKAGRDVPTSGRAEPSPEVLARIREAGDAKRPYFAWLEPRDGQLHVFVSVLLGGGVLVSAGAWVIDRVAGKTAGPALERDLAERLKPLALPDGGLLADDVELVAAGSTAADDEALRLLLGPAVQR